MKALAKTLLNKFGYVLHNKKEFAPRDLRDKGKDPVSAKYLARGSNFVINAKPENCIMFWKFSCAKVGNNPFVNTVTDYLQSGHDKYSNSLLEQYYLSYQPNNVAELFNLEGELHEDLIHLPAHIFAYPWENAGMKMKKQGVEKAVKRVTKNRGYELSIKHGSSWFGPSSSQRGKLEIDLLISLTNSIKKRNYQRSDSDDGDIIASVLIDGDNYKYLIHDGSHRITVLSALDYEVVPIRVAPRHGMAAYIYRNDVESWPNVQRGLYTIPQALKIFDTIFSGAGVTDVKVKVEVNSEINI